MSTAIRDHTAGRIRLPMRRHTCLGLFHLLLIMLLSTVITMCDGFETFFSVSDVHVTLPQSPDIVAMLQDKPLLQFVAKRLHPLSYHRVVQDSTSSADESIESSLANPFNYDIYKTYDRLSIKRQSGEISMTGQQIGQLGANVTVIVEASPVKTSGDDTSDDGNNTGDQAKMSLTIETRPVRSYQDYCNDMLENVCFWDRVVFKIAENSVAWNQTVGQLGPRIYRHLCPDLNVQYVLQNGTAFFTVHGDTIFTNTRIDHDSLAPGPHLSVTVECRVTRPGNAVVHRVTRLLDFVVLDRNDNPPELHTTETNISVQLKDPYYTKGAEIGNGIMFSDSDSLSLNSQIRYDILNDPRDLVYPRCQAFDVHHMELHTSAINCKLYFMRNGHLDHSPYCIIIRASDPTVETPPNHSRKAAEATVCLYADMKKLHDGDRPQLIVAQALKSHAGLNVASAAQPRKRKNRKLVFGSDETSSSAGSGESSATRGSERVLKFGPIFYPHEVTVARRVTQLLRVVEPLNMRELTKSSRSPVFRIAEDRTGALGITSVAGIVYVRNATALQAAVGNVFNLTIEFANQTAHIRLQLVDSVAQRALPFVIRPCSDISSRKDCLAAHGHGTNGTGCQWRPNNATGMTTAYATCSPDLVRCPDNLCDPFESMAQRTEEFLCPQDCTASAQIFGPHTSNDDRMGIRSASGICTCDETGKCSCGPHLADVVPKPKKGAAFGGKRGASTGGPATLSTELAPGNVSFVRKDLAALAVEECGVTCMLLIVLCPIVLVVLVASVVVSRRRITRKHRKSDHKPELSDDVPADATETLALAEFPANRITILSTLPTEFSFTSDPDSKWEFPRDQLQLDTVLGEGEFGRVVRGFANGISGREGVVTTVAVKMLKTGANSVELLALLSEFQLLQEVRHPNVIQLLGACTQESPLVIIEYAKHGSLRNYLRLSRKLECSGIEYSDGVEPVQVRDILSFALQICKGMAYLTDIKLVHRDLAARNVLLTEGKICKISDFGLTRDVYEDDAYLKRSKDRVPVKWMAPESLADHVYTTRSDVWAFGVLAWELITLGASPYPGIPPQNLYHLLKSGYRMERPENCSEEVYAIVRSCWTEDPHVRPPFKWLASQWEGLLGNNAKYIEMELSGVSNPLYCAEEETTAVVTAPGDASGEDTTDGGATDKATTAAGPPPNDFGEPDKIDHLWHPPRTPTQSVSTPDRSATSGGGGQQLFPMGYDIPRPLIETRTDEQMLRYQNELRTSPLRTIAAVTPGGRRSGVVEAVDLSHYDRPAVLRRKSYMDMLAIERTGSVGYNLDRPLADKKRLTKDITFRFSSLLNLSEHFTSPPM